MTNRDFLKQVSTGDLPDAATVLDRAQKPRSVWRRVAVAAVAAVAIGALVTVGAQVHMNELEKIEASTGKESITDITLLETGKLYTIENHSERSENDPMEATYYYNVYNELPEGINPRELPRDDAETFSDSDESRGICMSCRGYAWTPSEPVEYSYQRPSASEPEIFHIRTLNCAQCGYQLEPFDADGKVIPRGLSDEIFKAFRESREVEKPNIEGLTLIENSEELEKDTLYRAFTYKASIYFYESTPENNAKVSSWLTCTRCTLNGDHDAREFLLGDYVTQTYVDEYYGDEYIFSHYEMICAKCGEVAFAFVDD